VDLVSPADVDKPWGQGGPCSYAGCTQHLRYCDKWETLEECMATCTTLIPGTNSFITWDKEIKRTTTTANAATNKYKCGCSKTTTTNNNGAGCQIQYAWGYNYDGSPVNTAVGPDYDYQTYKIIASPPGERKEVKELQDSDVWAKSVLGSIADLEVDLELSETNGIQSSSWPAGHACTDCPAGKARSGSTGECTVCAAGKKSAAGASSCENCGANTYSVLGAATCSNCAEGQESPAGSENCTQTCTWAQTDGYCRGGDNWPNTNEEWSCFEDDSGNRKTHYTEAACRTKCEAEPICGAYDREGGSNDGHQSECCLFKAGNTGNGGWNRHCWVKTCRL